jgi:hypothetical protein
MFGGSSPTYLISFLSLPSSKTKYVTLYTFTICIPSDPVLDDEARFVGSVGCAMMM